MKSIQPVHSLRISVQPRELTIGQVQELCTIPYQYAQRTITAFLNAVCEHLPRPPGHEAVTDPLLWSVNERMNVTIFYLAAILDENPDFKLGDGHLHDYLLGASDYVEHVEFEHRGEPYICTPLHGYQAEAIESLVETGALPKTYFSWQLGVMSACIRGAEEAPIVYVDPSSYRKALKERIELLRTAPESEFLELFDKYFEAAQKLQHFVHAVFNAHGVLAAQVTEPGADLGDGKEVPKLGPARFHPRSGISRGACELLEANDEHQG
ncbi:hypothetical protein C1893_23165 [Pseudomonas sp. MPR-ANC1]|uniref:hypothetical protein n=1 Tax=Pseudomonas sp. MPR-ANC1 TaxID=2075548 RepID=UPI000CD1F681|nr:hypothetical protein [Pseudomonas sp. MPR-ANC1]POA45559.1 hypothetical protein C1893_23165 [Pseudomonas sp. MPR-ANC1]